MFRIRGGIWWLLEVRVLCCRSFFKMPGGCACLGFYIHANPGDGACRSVGRRGASCGFWLGSLLLWLLLLDRWLGLLWWLG